MQHKFILKGIGGKLVHAPVTLDGESSVLESATGSGILFSSPVINDGTDW